MAGAVDDPTFPARAHLLLGAMRKSSSSERLRMLAGMLFGKPFLKTPAADLERVDLLAERLLAEDVPLGRAAAPAQTAPPARSDELDEIPRSTSGQAARHRR